MIYSFCGVTFLLLALTYIIVLVGVWNLKARVCGFCYLCCLWCVNLAAIITTAVFRFNTMG